MKNSYEKNKLKMYYNSKIIYSSITRIINVSSKQCSTNYTPIACKDILPTVVS